jgi:DNA-binding LytR/AlgR family response regulator
MRDDKEEQGPPGWIVNMKAVRALHGKRGGRSWLELKDGRELPVRRSRLHALRGQIV